MSELICEETSRRAGFAVSVGNWIAPDGSLVCGTSYESHHWETIQEYQGGPVKTDNQLEYMHNIIQQGFIRLVFRTEVCFQVGAVKLDELWSDAPNYKTMMKIIIAIADIKGVDIHIFSKNFYVIGSPCFIISADKDNLQIKEMG